MTSLGALLLPFLNLVSVNNLLLDHVGQLHVFDLAVHLVNHFDWMGRGDHSKTLLILLPLFTVLLYRALLHGQKLWDEWVMAQGLTISLEYTIMIFPNIQPYSKAI